jgi:predicted DsbA family dithiol-disulfide isomerase
MVERLFRAHFAEGRQLGGIDDLVALAAEVGLDPDEVRAALDDGTYAPAVAADLEQARAYGISAVPFFVLDGRYGVAGAQSPDVIAGALAEASAAGQGDVGDR